MKIGIGVPNHVAGVRAADIPAWARAAEQRGFDCVASIDCLTYPALDAVVALSLAAAVTSELTLVSNVLLAPLYPAAVLAKQLASLPGAAHRLVVGVGVGSRPEDYRACGADFGRRGRILDEQIPLMRRIWSGEPVAGSRAFCPSPIAIPVLFGGHSEATIRRVAALGDGWAAGGVRDYRGQAAFADSLRVAWRAASRSRSPYLQTSVSFALGDRDVVQSGRDHLAQYYGFRPDFAALNVADMPASVEEVRDTVRRYRELGFDRLIFHPTVTAPDQVDRLADAVLGLG